MMHATLVRKPRVSPCRQRDEIALAAAVLLGALDALLAASDGKVERELWLSTQRGRDEGERRAAAALGCGTVELHREE